MRSEILDRLERDGYAIIDSFFSADEVNELIQAAKSLCFEAPKEERRISSLTDEAHTQDRQKYFMDSAYKISYFFEPGSVNKNNELLVPPELSLERVGHCLHVEHPVFRKYTFDNRVREVCWQLNFACPAIIQSSYYYKNPGSPMRAIAYQSGTFFYTEPPTTIGFYVALEDSNIENGCLKVARGSHRNGIHRRFVRTEDADGIKLGFDRVEPVYQMSNFTSLVVPKGTLILLHSQVVQRNEQNRSDKPNPCYEFHVVEATCAQYSNSNWLQPYPGKPFPILYQK